MVQKWNSLGFGLSLITAMTVWDGAVPTAYGQMDKEEKRAVKKEIKDLKKLKKSAAQICRQLKKLIVQKRLLSTTASTTGSTGSAAPGPKDIDTQIAELTNQLKGLLDRTSSGTDFSDLESVKELCADVIESLDDEIEDLTEECPECALRGGGSAGAGGGVYFDANLGGYVQGAQRRPSVGDYIIGGLQAATPMVLGGLGAWSANKMMNSYTGAYQNMYSQQLAACNNIGIPCPPPSMGFPGGGGMMMGGMGMGGMGGMGGLGGLLGGIGLGGGIGGGMGGGFPGGGMFPGGGIGGGIGGGMGLGGMQGCCGMNPYMMYGPGAIPMMNPMAQMYNPYGSMMPNLGFNLALGTNPYMGANGMSGMMNPYMSANPYLSMNPYMSANPYLGMNPYMNANAYAGIGANLNPYMMGGPFANGGGMGCCGGAGMNPYGMPNSYGNIGAGLGPWGMPLNTAGWGQMSLPWQNGQGGGSAWMSNNPQYQWMWQASMNSQQLEAQRAAQAQQNAMIAQQQVYEAQTRYYQTLMSAQGQGGYLGGPMNPMGGYSGSIAGGAGGAGWSYMGSGRTF